ncbi:class E sortase [Streptomyces sp. NBC_00536]|uniref:class E sortase n=1 Tax=Streptomyces sp. NBC_00536 TaxID=2975769 RepID=UPI002E81E438|nr:class E sortase [Streptomyces sp. NBC_00536]WUC80088.1 class E sortase [Streptomyces sp. NBC_00536]
MSRARRAAPRARAGSPSRLAGFLSLLGELLITVGLVLALFVAYSLWWTNVLADRHAAQRGDSVRQQWQAAPPAATPEAGALDTGDGIGFLHVPAMNNGEVLVKRGTSADVINDGVAGYYTDPVKSALPWDKQGNVTLAAHRDGHGAKFHNIDKVKTGDAVVFETRDTWYVYKVFAELRQTSKYNTDVITPVPKESGKTAPGRYITLTTCTPVYTSKFRYVVWGELVRTDKVDAQRTPPPELRK